MAGGTARAVLDVYKRQDKADVDETNATAKVENISKVFEQTQVAPETDALFLSKVAAKAQATDGYHSATKSTEWTKASAYSKLKTILSAGKLRRDKADVYKRQMQHKPQ